MRSGSVRERHLPARRSVTCRPGLLLTCKQMGLYMGPTKQRGLILSRYLLLAYLLAIIVIALRAAITLKAMQSSGILVVTAPAPGTFLSVTQGSHTAAYI